MSDKNSDQRDGVSADAYEPEDDAASVVDGEAEGAAQDTAELSGRVDWQRAVAEQRDKYLRLAAEYENFRKRANRERQEAGSRGQAELIRGLLDPLDDLSRFAHVDPLTVDATTVVDGAAMVERKMLKLLTSSGLEVVNPLDQPFDPAVHEAVATEPALSAEDDHMIARVYQAGYVFNGQLLRPARVVVKQWNG